MSNTLGMPSLTPSNATGHSGISQSQLGVLGTGVLNTIEEGVGGTSVKPFYYGTGSAFYQIPSVQRSHGDDVKSFNVKTFGSRGSINVPRKWMNYGPTQLFFTYPINYAWAGPEYYCRILPKTIGFNALQGGGGLAAANTFTNDLPMLNTAKTAHLIGDLACEVRSGPNILPTYFWSGGVGFAFPQMTELNMGGGGNLVFDRYSNFALIMASTPTISMREHLMRMAGGGLYYDHETDFDTLPVKFGYVPNLTDEGVAINRDVGDAAAAENFDSTSMCWAPIEWQIQVPIKTPETNFWNSLLGRRPLDTSCLASDLQYIVTFANFFEFSDTGTGLANNPYYLPLDHANKLPADIATEYAADPPAWSPDYALSVGHVSDKRLLDNTDTYIRYATGGNSAVTQWPAPSAIATQMPVGYFYTSIPTDNGTGASPAVQFPNRIGSNPRIWNNHYRVCNGSIYAGYGKGRPKFPVPGGVRSTVPNYMKDVTTVANARPATISYAPGFSRAEWRNHSLKFTNPALSARMPLQMKPELGAYYPFTYAFAQTYRVAPTSNPFDAASFHRWCSNQAIDNPGTPTGQNIKSVLFDTLSINNRITQNIQMPANPVTTMIIGIYREKDRKYLGANTAGTYSPALFWNGLQPLRATLYDGGNILFDYAGPTAHHFYSMYDRPDVLKIPFRGGLCQQDPNNILPSPFDIAAGVGGSYPDGTGHVNSGLSRWVRQQGGVNQHGHRFQPLHCTEWYNCTLLEFPFVMHEPLSREGSVQSTPSFAKTILRFEFYLDALLKPSRGLDDMYDLTTVPPTTWVGITATGATPHFAAAAAGNTVNIALSVPSAYVLDDVQNFNAYSDNREANIYYANAGARSAGVNPNPTISPNARSWNVNDGGLLIHVTFGQNQIWIINPNRTTILSARG